MVADTGDHRNGFTMSDTFPFGGGLTFLAFLLGQTSVVLPAETPSPMRLCRIEVVEKGSGWPVPLVELRTTHNVRFVRMKLYAPIAAFPGQILSNSQIPSTEKAQSFNILRHFGSE